MKKSLTLAAAALITASLMLGGCGGAADSSATPTPTVSAEATPEATPETTPEVTPEPVNNLAAMDEVLAKFPGETSNSEASIDGGILKVAVPTESGFKGLFDIIFYEDANDGNVADFIAESALSTDDSLMYSQNGLCTFTYDKDAKTLTLTQQYEATWHDGQPVTMDDLLFAHEVICHADYDGIRYDDSLANIVGVKEYHEGTADTISGITVSEDKKQITFQFIDFYPSILYGAGIWSYPAPRHHYEGIAVKDMSASPQARSKALNFGPFKIKNVVEGESVELERFDGYWQGAPKLAGVTLECIAAALVPTAMEEGRFDIAEPFSTQQYPNFSSPTNYSYLSAVTRGFNYTGFRLGTFDKEKNTNVVNPDAKMANVNLRKAIAYAVDNGALAKDFFNGLRFPATTIITPFHAAFMDTTVPGYLYNPELARQLLDEAGYVDVDGDGFREDPKGEKLTIIWAMMQAENADTIAQFKIQCWEDIGLKVELYNGQLTEFNAFYDMIEEDTDNGVLDIYDGGWTVGYDPNPASLWGPDTVNNFTRYQSDRLNAILKDIASDKAWDSEWLAQKYSEWQYAIFDEVPVTPTLWRVDLAAVNNRVKNYSIIRKDGTGEISLGAFHLIELTADQPYVK